MTNADDTHAAGAPPTPPMEPALGRLERVDPRVIWPHEAHDFTTWLAENADRLAEAVGIDLEIARCEHPVGSFSVDLIDRDITHDKPLIVENQLEPSERDRLRSEEPA